MFCEGLHMFVLLNPFNTISSKIQKAGQKVYHYVGWGLPIIPIFIWVLLKSAEPDYTGFCWARKINDPSDNDIEKFLIMENSQTSSQNSSQRSFWSNVDIVYQFPILVALGLNILILAYIFITIRSKLSKDMKQANFLMRSKFHKKGDSHKEKDKSQNKAKFQKFFQLAASTASLIPLLGLQNLLFPVQTILSDSFKVSAWGIILRKSIQVLNTILFSSTGILIACIWCFLNKETRMILAKRIRKMKLDHQNSKRARCLEIVVAYVLFPVRKSKKRNSVIAAQKPDRDAFELEHSLISNRDNSQIGSLSMNHFHRRVLCSSSTTKHRSSMTLSTQLSSPVTAPNVSLKDSIFGNHLEPPKNCGPEQLGTSENGLHRSLNEKTTQSIIHSLNASRRNSYQPVSLTKSANDNSSAQRARNSIQPTLSSTNLNTYDAKLTEKLNINIQKSFSNQVKRVLQKPMDNLKNTANRYSFQADFYRANSEYDTNHKYHRHISGKNTTSLMSGPVSPTSGTSTSKRPNILRSNMTSVAEITGAEVPSPESTLMRSTRSSTLETNLETREQF